MPSGTTPILGLTIPTVGGDANQWGTELNGNLSLLDFLGGMGIFPVSSAFTVLPGPQFERFYRVTTGGLNVPGTLPDPATIPPGKVFTIMVADIGGSATLSCVNPAVTIQGQSTFVLANQFAVVRLLANGVNYDVIGVV